MQYCEKSIDIINTKQGTIEWNDDVFSAIYGAAITYENYKEYSKAERYLLNAIELSKFYEITKSN